MKEYQFQTKVEWTGNTGSGTFDARSYDRSHTISVPNKKQIIEASSSSFFRGDESKLNPQELFLSAISSCHLMWYLQYCAENEVIVLEYQDHAEATIEEFENGGGKFKSVLLKPQVIVSEESMIPLAIELHKTLGEKCFIANSCNFPIYCEPQISVDK
jgi:organic hydroperoxide reductase OsmC/OhrA